MFCEKDSSQGTIGMKAKRAQAIGEAVVGYMRVSTTRQGDKGISLELQESAIYQFAQACGLPVLRIFQDVASGRGRSSIHRRDGLRQALAVCRKHDAILVVWDWSRLSREVSTEEVLLKLLPPPERVHSIRDDESFDDARKHARFVNAQEERDLISQRTIVAMDQLKRAGVSFGNPNIRKVQVRGRVAWSDKSKEIARSIAAVLRSLPDWKALKRREIADELNKRGLLTGHDLRWNASRLRKPLELAEKMLRDEDDDAMRKHPTYGLF
jgi:DNA invertase Pin-like site-specific DNA recombinase